GKTLNQSSLMGGEGRSPLVGWVRRGRSGDQSIKVPLRGSLSNCQNEFDCYAALLRKLVSVPVRGI
ncbi:MAG: hypothetical protein EAZ28_05980, partial [Oscillatoriales cyanobacterium]